MREPAEGVAEEVDVEGEEVEEVEAREGHALGLQVLLQALLDAVQRLVVHVELVQQLDFTVLAFEGDQRVQTQRLLAGASHDGLPAAVHDQKLLRLGWELLLNVLGPEDVLQVHPLLLNEKNGIEGITDGGEGLFPCLNSVLEGFDEL